MEDAFEKWFDNHEFMIETNSNGKILVSIEEIEIAFRAGYMSAYETEKQIKKEL